MKKLFERGNKAAVGHGRPAGAAAARTFAESLLAETLTPEQQRQLLGKPFGRGLTLEDALWRRALFSEDADLSHRALVRLEEWKWGKPRESVEVSTPEREPLFGGPEGLAQVAILLEMVQLPNPDTAMREALPVRALPAPKEDETPAREFVKGSP